MIAKKQAFQKFKTVFRLTSFCLSTTVLISLMAKSATAVTYWETVRKNATVVIDTALGNLTAEQEVNKINQNWRDWRAFNQGVIPLAQVGINDLYPVIVYGSEQLGSTEVLTYFFIDSVTGLRTTPGFEVGSVSYYALLEPPTLNASDLTESIIKNNLTFLGTSTNSSNHFALNFTLQGFEPIILASAFDAAGNKIVSEGASGFASHVVKDVPEPTSILGLLTFGAFGAASTLKHKLKPSKSSENRLEKAC